MMWVISAGRLEFVGVYWRAVNLFAPKFEARGGDLELIKSVRASLERFVFLQKITKLS
jgi:hypothetical protein